MYIYLEDLVGFTKQRNKETKIFSPFIGQFVLNFCCFVNTTPDPLCFWVLSWWIMLNTYADNLID